MNDQGHGSIPLVGVVKIFASTQSVCQLCLLLQEILDPPLVIYSYWSRERRMVSELYCDVQRETFSVPLGLRWNHATNCAQLTSLGMYVKHWWQLMKIIC